MAMTNKNNDTFFWGAASAAHQVEGNNRHNQWWAFENMVGTQSGERSGKCCDQYRLFQGDFRMLKKLGHTAHRISFEWSRFFPNGPDRVSQSAIRHYRQVINALKELAIEPFVTLFHFTIPQWFAERGGFAQEKNLGYFDDFVRIVAKEFTDVRYWFTVNEPMVYALQSYITRDFPPAKTNVSACIRVIKNLVRAHARAYHILKAENPSCMVGPVQHCTYLEPVHRMNPLDRLITRGIDWFFNYMFLDAVTSGTMTPPFALWRHDPSLAGTADLIGINYYTRMYVGALAVAGRSKRTKERRTLMDWTEYPDGIAHFIHAMTKRYARQVFIAENGIATDDDAWRADFIRRHVSAVLKAKADGADVRGYFHWSNLDNYEWQRGFSPHFGLIAVARDGTRRIKESAFVYRDHMRKMLRTLLGRERQ